MSNIFISYRRNDTAYIAGRLHDHLSERFGEEHVFRDVQTMTPGVDFVAKIHDAVGACDAFLAVIGDGWLEADAAGARRIDDPNDWVRTEVAAALERDVLVIPVLVEHAVMPPESQLPPELRPLTRRNALNLSDRNWDYELEGLLEALGEVVKVPARSRPTGRPSDPASLLPDYEIGAELGSGAFGIVRAGRHLSLDREVAIKELPPALATDPDVRARFAAEARVLASLSHPHIVPVYDFVERHGICLLVMEQLTGGTVWRRFTESGFTPETACVVVMAACSGLHYAHDRKVLHRDVKPENLLFSSDQVVKVSDFGIAKVIGGAETLATRGGEILGTPAYIAPEQAEGRPLGPAADIYSAGVMLYELLSGQLPYSEEGGALATVYRHVYEDPMPLQEVAPTIPVQLAEVTMQALARSPEGRYRSAEDFGVAIGESMTSAMGPEWLARSEVKVVHPGRIAESAQPRTTRTGSRSTLPPKVNVAGRGTMPPPEAVRRRTVPEDQGAPTARPSGARVRPTADEHVAGAAAADIAQADLVPVRDVIELPPPPLVQIAGAVLLIVLTLIVAFAGIGSPSRTQGIEPGVVTLDGADPAAGPVELDLGKPVEVRLTGSPAGPPATEVQLGFSVAGFPLPSSTTGALTPSDGGSTATVEAEAARYLLAGEATGELRLLNEQAVVVRHDFSMDSAQPSLLSLPGILTLAVLLFLAAYVESLLRPLRRGKRRPVNAVGLVIIGAALGVVAVGLVWMVGGPEPTIATAILCALLGAAAGGVAALGAMRTGQRARIRPRVRAARGV